MVASTIILSGSTLLLPASFGDAVRAAVRSLGSIFATFDLGGIWKTGALGVLVAMCACRSAARSMNYVHHIIVKLLVAPGKLFHGWNPQQHGPLDRRNGESDRNEFAIIICKYQNRRKYVPYVSITNDFNGHDVAEK